MSTMREPEGVKLFIGQVPKDYKEADLRSIFEVFGEIHSLNLLHDKSTGQHKGCAFLTFYDNVSAKKAQEDLHEKRTLPGARNPMQVKPAASETNEENRKLFIGMISRDLTDDELKDMFSSFGSIESITILRDPQGKSKGCAFVKYETRLQAQNAIKTLHNSQTMSGCSKPIVVKLADTEKDKAGRRLFQGGQSSNVGIGSGVVGGAIPNVATAAGLTSQLLQQQTAAYYQQLLAQVAFPQLLAANPGLAAMASSATHPTGTTQTNLSKQASYGIQNNNQGAIGTIPLVNSNYPGVQQYITALPQQSSAFFQGSSSLPSASDSKKEGPPGANLFIYQIPTEYTDADLIQTFLPFGNVISAKVFIDKNTQMSKGFGFVSYDNPNSATAAISSMNGFVIGSKRLKVQLKKAKEQGKPY